MVFSISVKRLSGSWAWWVELGGEGGALVWCGSFNKRTPRYGGIPAKKAVSVLACFTVQGGGHGGE